MKNLEVEFPSKTTSRPLKAGERVWWHTTSCHGMPSGSRRANHAQGSFSVRDSRGFVFTARCIQWHNGGPLWEVGKIIGYHPIGFIPAEEFRNPPIDAEIRESRVDSQHTDLVWNDNGTWVYITTNQQK